MRRRMLLNLTLVGSLFAAAAPLCAQATSNDEEEGVVVIKMVDKSPTEFAYEPAHVTVAPGTVLRFVQAGDVYPHNVDFRTGGLKGTMSPFLTKAGETWEITIDDRFAPGVHEFVCTPHEFMGMKGTVTVQGDGS